MFTEDDKIQRIRQAQKKLIPNLLINLLLPWLLYLVMRPHFPNDAVPLAITAIIPALKTLIQLAWQRRIDWIGLFSTVILVIALTVTYFSGGNALPLKIVQPVIIGLISLVLLISVLIGKPLFLILFNAFGKQKKELFNKPLMRKKLTLMTLLFGGVLFIALSLYIISALVFPTGIFLAINNMISVGTIAVLTISAKVIAPKMKS